MKQEIKDRWVAALESGEYSQATGMLTDGEGFCCLGVLCELAVAAGVVIRDYGVYVNPEDSEDISDAELPHAVQVWAGLDQTLHGENPKVRTPSLINREYLSVLNDDMGYNFNQIADAIKNDSSL